MTRKVLLLVLVLAVLVTGCGAGSAAAYLDKNRPLVDVQPSRYGNEEARVYQMEGTVPEAARDLAERYKPQKISEEKNDRMVLVYSDYIVDIYDQEGTTMAEAASFRYVRDHYDSGSFFSGYLTAMVIRDIFSGPRSYGGGGSLYNGRNSVPSYGKTVREGSVGAPVKRGGGIFGGK